MADAFGVRRIVVSELFGSERRNYDIHLETDAPTVLTGSNGTGKSTILRLINAVAVGDLRMLATAPLKGFELHFRNGPTFQLFRNFPRRGGQIVWGRDSIELPDISTNHELPIWAIALVEEYSPAAVPSAVLMRAAQSAGEPFSVFSAVEKMVEALGEQDTNWKSEVPEWYAAQRHNVPVLFVTDQRLVVESSTSRKSQATNDSPKAQGRAVDELGQDLLRDMRRLDSVYTRQSQLQDRRFPKDVILALTEGSAVSALMIGELELEVGERRDRLRSVGLLAEDTDFGSDIPAGSFEIEVVRPVLQTFWRSTLKKLDVMEALAVKLIAFKSFLDGQFVDKVTVISKMAGISFVSDAGQPLRPDQLSSGEQQMMILAYEILFRARVGTLVILDEPEISLHVQWQHDLLDSIMAMGAASDLQFLLATHSPTLISSHRELERSLDEI